AMAGWRASRGRGRGSEARGSRAFPFDLNRCHTAKPRATSTRWLFSLAHVRLEGTSVRALCPPLVLLWAYVDVPAGPMPSPLSRSPPGKIEVPVRTDSYSVTATTPGTGSSMALMIVVLTGTSATCLLSAVSSGRFFLTAGFFALMPARWILDFAFFGVACFAAILRAGLVVLALPRFKLFLRAATRFFVALAMAISCKACRRHGHLNTSELCCLISKRFATRRRDVGFHGGYCGQSRKHFSF